jgi:acyl-coenzyme A synthetase/AMP-(fatty) acid ligase
MPAQVDSALLSHPLVTEAVSFGAPDEKYGESVAAAVVLSKPVDDVDATIADIKKAAAAKLSKFKVTPCVHKLCT